MRMTSHRQFLCAFVALGFAGTAWSQADPTKPSAAWLAAHGGQPMQAETGLAGAQIVLSGASRRFVVVDGNIVRPGQVHNGAKLVSVGDGNSVWQKGGVRETPDMSPAVQKTPVVVAQAQAAKKQNHKKQVNGELR